MTSFEKERNRQFYRRPSSQNPLLSIGSMNALVQVRNQLQIIEGCSYVSPKFARAHFGRAQAGSAVTLK